MIMEILFGVMATICALSLFLLLADPAENEKACTVDIRESRWMRFQQNKLMNDPPLLKNVILAMAQSGIYFLSTVQEQRTDCGDGSEGNDIRWTLAFIANSSAKLDAYSPTLIEMEKIVIDFCEKIDELINVWKNNVYKYHETLSFITTARLSIEEELCQLTKCEVEQQQATLSTKAAEVNNDYSDRKHMIAMTSTCHPIIANEDYITSVYDQFVNSILIKRPIIKCSKPLVAANQANINTAW